MTLHRFCVTLLTVIKMATLFCQAEYNNSENYLISEVLLKNYNPLVKPVTNSSQPLHLSLGMGLRTFIELDMKKQTWVSLGWFVVTWYDQFLRWDLNQYPFHLVRLKPDMVWRPDLVISNTVSDLDQLEDQKRLVMVYHSGKVIWFIGGLLQTRCSIDIFHYPMDTQTCTVEVTPWSSNIYDLTMAVNDPVYDTYVPPDNHPEWSLLGQKAEYVRQDDTPTVQFTFTLKRKMMFYIFNMILPIFLLSLMNCVVFLLSADSGEKMTVSVTMFLSFAVFLSVINNSLPPNSNTVCLFSVYVAVQMFASVCSIIMAACIVAIYDKDTDSYTAPQSQGKSSKICEGETSWSVISKPYTNTLPRGAQGPVADSTTRNPSAFTVVFGNTESPQASTASKDTVSGKRNEEEKGSVSVKEASGSLSIRRVCSMFRRFHDLKSVERRLLSQQLNKLCFKLTVSMTIAICLVFCLIWFFA